MIWNRRMNMEVADRYQIGRDLKHNAIWLFVMALFISLYVLISAGLFEKFGMHDKIPAQDGGHYSYFDSVYFTVINITEVGFGDIVPATKIGKLIAMMNSFVGLIIIGLFVSLFSFAFQPSDGPRVSRRLHQRLRDDEWQYFVLEIMDWLASRPRPSALKTRIGEKLVEVRVLPDDASGE